MNKGQSSDANLCGIFSASANHVYILYMRSAHAKLRYAMLAHMLLALDMLCLLYAYANKYILPI